MKKIIILFLLLSAVSQAQKITIAKEKVPELLCQKWVTNFAMMNKTKINQLPKAQKIQLRFSKDNSYELSNSNKVTGKGTWSYDAKNKCVHLLIGNKETSKIISLSKTEFVMTLVPEKNSKDKLANITFHFKPKT